MLAIQRSPAGFQRVDIDYGELVQSRLIGNGRFGRVYEYEWNGTTVSVKDIAVCTEDQNRLTKVLRESDILKKLNHKNIITLHDTQMKRQNLLLVMELAAGGSMSGALAKYGPLDSNVITNWAAQIANGLCYLHENDVVHRDLKSNNVLVLEPMDSCLIRKTLKIADFGLAIDDYDGTRTMSEPAGAVLWMAPEAREPPHHFSKASDVWSFGVILWSMLKGKEPSTANYQLSATTKDFGSVFAKILNKCWQAEHKHRSSIRTVCTYLEHMLSNEQSGSSMYFAAFKQRQRGRDRQKKVEDLERPLKAAEMEEQRRHFEMEARKRQLAAEMEKERRHFEMEEKKWQDELAERRRQDLRSQTLQSVCDSSSSDSENAQAVVVRRNGVIDGDSPDTQISSGDAMLAAFPVLDKSSDGMESDCK